MVKKLNMICTITGIICFLLAGYIVYNKFFNKEEIIFDKEKELEQINDKLAKVGSQLGWLIIVDGINNQNEDGTKYNISYDTDLLKDEYNKQLFTMEYILSTGNETDNFIVLSGFDNSKMDAKPTDDYTIAYLKYDIFNKYYKDFFTNDFDITKQNKGNTSYDKEYVYYSNRRAGSNNVYVPMITSSDVEYKDKVYTADIEIIYSTRAGELIGKEKDTGTITYTKDINDNIIFKTFILNK